MLLILGGVGLAVPGVSGAPALAAAGMILWPGGIGRLEPLLSRRFPETHRTGLVHMSRLAQDLERRYPANNRRLA